MWNKVRVLKGKDFNAEAVHDDKYLTTKIKFFANEIKRDFHDDGIPQEQKSKFNLCHNMYWFRLQKWQNISSSNKFP